MRRRTKLPITNLFRWRFHSRWWKKNLVCDPLNFPPQPGSKNHKMADMLLWSFKNWKFFSTKNCSKVWDVWHCYLKRISILQNSKNDFKRFQHLNYAMLCYNYAQRPRISKGISVSGRKEEGKGYASWINPKWSQEKGWIDKYPLKAGLSWFITRPQLLTANIFYRCPMLSIAVYRGSWPDVDSNVKYNRLESKTVNSTRIIYQCYAQPVFFSLYESTLYRLTASIICNCEPLKDLLVFIKEWVHSTMFPLQWDSEQIIGILKQMRFA